MSCLSHSIKAVDEVDETLEVVEKVVHIVPDSRYDLRWFADFWSACFCFADLWLNNLLLTLNWIIILFS